jgi:exocyst complex component 4
MDSVVEEYHDGFQQSINKFSGVVENISDSKIRVVKMARDLEQCKEWLGNKRYDLFHLWIKSMQYAETVRILDMVYVSCLNQFFRDELMKVPDKLDALLNGKFFLTACRTLDNAIKMANGPECLAIGALENIRASLDEQRRALPQILLDELQNHVYLKSQFSLDRLELGDGMFLDPQEMKKFNASCLHLISYK